MGSQHCGLSCDPTMRFKHMRFKTEAAATHHASLPQSF
jgi:hypothetical protein